MPGYAPKAAAAQCGSQRDTAPFGKDGGVLQDQPTAWAALNGRPPRRLTVGVLRSGRQRRTPDWRASLAARQQLGRPPGLQTSHLP